MSWPSDRPSRASGRTGNRSQGRGYDATGLLPFVVSPVEPRTGTMHSGGRAGARLGSWPSVRPSRASGRTGNRFQGRGYDATGLLPFVVSPVEPRTGTMHSGHLPEQGSCAGHPSALRGPQDERKQVPRPRRRCDGLASVRGERVEPRTGTMHSGARAGARLGSWPSVRPSRASGRTGNRSQGRGYDATGLLPFVVSGSNHERAPCIREHLPEQGSCAGHPSALRGPQDERETGPKAEETNATGLLPLVVSGSNHERAPCIREHAPERGS